MADEYVRKEIFDARMDRMEALLEKTLIEMKSEVNQLRTEMNQLRTEMNQLRTEVKADIGQLRADVRAEISDIRGDVRALSAHIESLEFWGAIIIGAVTIGLSVAQYLQSRRETIAAEVKEQVRDLRKTVLELVEAGKIAAARPLGD
ncbi:MAG: DUF1640 domain-containing protein [Fretibacterium sp.]|nr:DUF1640 domain-containing protein [Fretibacterium sp.]